MGREGFSTAAAWLLLLVSWETQGGRRVAGLCRHVRGPRVRKLKALQRSLQLIGGLRRLGAELLTRLAMMRTRASWHTTLSTSGSARV